MNPVPDYTFGTASLEIIVLLVVAFLLGMLLCWLSRTLGICCTGRTVKTDNYRHQPVTAGGYTADIDSLLRSSSPASANTTSPADTPTVTHRVTDVKGTTATEDDSLAEATVTHAGILASIKDLGGDRKDDLKKLEGIGPKIEKILNTAGIRNFEQLAAVSADHIRLLLDAAGSQFKMHDPKTWPYQAELAAKGEWERLKEYQDILIGGKE